MKPRNITDQRFGRLTAMHRAYSKAGRTFWHFRCDCGREKSIYLQSVTRGLSRSCGCLESEARRIVTRTHGETCNGRISTEYMTWSNMRARCTNAARPDFSRYGGRGIRVCPRWADSFEAFLADMGRRPSPDHSIDRIDNDGNYEPGNCRWAETKDQSRNRRSSRVVVLDGQSVPLLEACEKVGLPYKSVWYRIRAGWDIRAALDTPLGASC